jgi:carbon-monoxide dehydrogenase small subunit
MLEYKGLTKVTLDINDEKYEVVVRPSDILLEVLRDKLGLTGAKPGCKNGDCGACTVLIDNIPIKSCLTLAVEAIGHRVTTIEGLKNTPIQQEFIKKQGFQCGYCTSGFIMNCYSLIINKPDADDETIEEWLQSNICRCTSYEEIEAAVKSAIKKQRDNI